jgi:1,4-alpha-glucan branching enzyme
VVEKAAATEWKWVSFEYHAGPGSEVFVGGTFNRWKPSRFDKLRDRRADGNYRTLLKLKRGHHEYNFLVNGAWLSDPRDSSNNNALNVV